MNEEELILESFLKDLERYKPLTDEQEAVLSAKALAGDARAREMLVKSNLKFVVSIARQYVQDGVSIMDLISEGSIALIKAAGKFDASKGKRFTQYAVWDIRKAMEASLPTQQEQMVKRSATEYLDGGDTADKKATDTTTREELETMFDQLPERERKVMRMLMGFEGNIMTMAEIGDNMGLKRERVRQIRNSARRKMKSIF